MTDALWEAFEEVTQGINALYKSTLSRDSMNEQVTCRAGARHSAGPENEPCYSIGYVPENMRERLSDSIRQAGIELVVEGSPGAFFILPKKSLTAEKLHKLAFLVDKENDLAQGHVIARQINAHLFKTGVDDKQFFGFIAEILHHVRPVRGTEKAHAELVRKAEALQEQFGKIEK